MVHASCWLDRLQLCMRVGVASVKCAGCWAVLWTPQSCARKHSMEIEEESDRPWKKQTLAAPSRKHFMEHEESDRPMKKQFGSQ